MALEKATLTNTVTGVRTPVMFNPEEYTVSKDNAFAQANVFGLSGPILQFVHGNAQTLELELFLDTNEAHGGGTGVANKAGDDVRDLVRRVTDLMNIEPATHAPPVVLFVWGSLSFTCVLAKATQRYVRFRPDGVPVRARVQTVFQEYRSAETEAKEVKRETADYTKLYRVAQGETLSGVAAKVYADPRPWRAIALRNGIDRPRQLAAGRVLVIPRLPYRDPDSGEVVSG